MDRELLHPEIADFADIERVLAAAVDRVDGAELFQQFASLAKLSNDGSVETHLVDFAGRVEVVRRIRETKSRVPILVLSAKSELDDRVRGLDAGADDYMGKPFAFAELSARVRALLRRGIQEDTRLRIADLEMDPSTRDVRRGDRPISLTRTEFALLGLLLAHPKQVLTRSRILEDVWGYDFPTSGNALEVYIGYLRRKTEAAGEPRLIQTVRGVGYALRGA